MEKILDKLIKYFLYLLVFLFPLWFLPWTNFPVVLNKQILLSVFVFLLVILWMVKIIISGKVNLSWGKLPLAIIPLLVILAISTAFSSSRIQSFWGMNFEPDTLFSFILYILFFFLLANLINESGARNLISVFLLSSGILALLFLIQTFRPIFPWDFAKTPGFNPVGSAQALAVFLGGTFVILVALISDKIISKKTFQGLVGLLGVLLFIPILFINFWVAWLGIVFGLTIIIFGVLKKLSRNLILPLIILTISLVFLFLKLPLPNILNIPAEVNPSYQATLDISAKTLKESPKNLILGSGPSTFGYHYSLYRSADLNLTDFWQIRFHQGAAVLPTFLTTLGILGVLAILLTMAIFFWQGLGTISPAFIGGFYFLISWFFYSSFPALFFASFLMMGLWQASFSSPKEFFFIQFPRKALAIMLGAVLLMVGSVIGLYTISQKYAGAVIYAQGLNLIRAEEPKLDEGIIKINKATTLDRKDIYFRNLSQAFLLKINEVLANQELSPEERQAELQRNISNAEISANNAVLINPKDSLNWLQLGLIYENFITFNIKGVEELAITNYQKAQELDPQNPQIPFNIGRVYFATGQLDKAKEALQKSIKLKGDFQPALNLIQQIEAPRE